MLILTRTHATSDARGLLERLQASHPDLELTLTHTSDCDRTSAGDACTGGCPIHAEPAGATDTEAEVAAALEYLLGLAQEDPTLLEDHSVQVDSTVSFVHAGVLTLDAGLVLRTADGAAYQITVVRSR